MKRRAGLSLEEQRVLRAVDELLAQGDTNVGPIAAARLVEDVIRQPNRVFGLFDELTAKGLVVRREEFPRGISALTPAGRAALDAARAAAA